MDAIVLGGGDGVATDGGRIVVVVSHGVVVGGCDLIGDIAEFLDLYILWVDGSEVCEQHAIKTSQ